MEGLIRWALVKDTVREERGEVLGGDVGSVAGMDWTILKSIKLHRT